MAALWSLRGLSWRELLFRTCRRSWHDEVFGHAARLALYYFWGLFPALLFLMPLLNTFGNSGSEWRNALLDSIRHILPGKISDLMGKTIYELNAQHYTGAGTIFAAFTAAWAALNGTWAMIVGLNRAYEVEEQRHWWRISVLSFGLTILLGAMGLMALSTILCSSVLARSIGQHLGSPSQTLLFWPAVEWPVTVLFFQLCLAFVYRFGPNLRDKRWPWSTPGAVIATTVWVSSTLILRAYQNHFASSETIYGGLTPVATLLLWLYFTGAAILIGGEANSEIEKAAADAHHPDVRKPEEQRHGGPGE